MANEIEVPEEAPKYEPPHQLKSMKKVDGKWINTDDKKARVSREDRDAHKLRMEQQGLDPTAYPRAVPLKAKKASNE